MNDPLPPRRRPLLVPRPIRLPANPPNVGPVDVVTPFSQNDEKYLAESVAAALDQPGSEPLLHLVADGFTPSPETVSLAEDPRVRLYVNERNVGPYVSAMGTFPHHISDWYAVSDADDPDLPGRFWDSVTQLRRYDADLFGASMSQFADPGHPRSQAEVLKRPTHVSGVVWACSPLGFCVHSASVFRRSSFEALNGYRSLYCSGDSELNTRGRYAGWRIILSPAIHGRRRLRDDSLSRGGEWRVGEPKRVALLKTVTEHHSLWSEGGCDAAAYGGLPEAIADAGVAVPWAP